MSRNNFIPRMSAFIVSIIITVVIFFSAKNSNMGFEIRIQIFSFICSFFWLLGALRSSGLKKYKIVELIIDFFVIIGISFFLCVTVWHSRYLSIAPLISINSAEGGLARDSLYHSAIAAGIGYYGHPTLLVNSDAFHNYHFGSHIIMAFFARVLNIPAVFSYCYCYPAFFLPLYTYMFFSVTTRLRRYLGKQDKLSVIDMLLMTCFFAYVIFPKEFVNNLGWYKSSWIVSESYCVAATVFMLYFDILFKANESNFFENQRFRGSLNFRVDNC